MWFSFVHIYIYIHPSLLRMYTYIHHHLLKTTILSPKNCLGIFVENQLSINVRIYFWTLNSIPFIYMSILMSVHCLDYCNLVTFEIGKIEANNLVLLFQECFGYSHALNLYINFRTVLPISAKMLAGIFIRISLNM